MRVGGWNLFEEYKDGLKQNIIKVKPSSGEMLLNSRGKFDYIFLELIIY